MLKEHTYMRKIPIIAISFSLIANYCILSMEHSIDWKEAAKTYGRFQDFQLKMQEASVAFESLQQEGDYDEARLKTLCQTGILIAEMSATESNDPKTPRWIDSIGFHPNESVKDILSLSYEDFSHKVIDDSSFRNRMLALAAQAGCLWLVHQLLDYGADATEGFVLMRAVMGGHINIVQLLLERGASANAYKIKSFMGFETQTASAAEAQESHISSYYTALDLARYFNYTDVEQVLLCHGALTGAELQAKRSTEFSAPKKSPKICALL